MKLGIAGAGAIVPDFLAAAARLPAWEVAALCGTPRHREQAQALGAAHGIPAVVTDYAQMLRDPSLDFVYIAVPNHLHYAFARQALEAGRHVICEKPFCSNLRQARELAVLAEARGLYLFEAISNQYLPNYEKTRALLPALGRVRVATLNFSQYSRRYDAFCQGALPPVFDPQKSGGALMDLNLYNLYFLVGLFGAPQSLHYFANLERGIDTSGVLLLHYPGMQASLTAAKNCAAPCLVQLQGDRGCLRCDGPANSYASFTFQPNGGEATAYALNDAPERLYYELARFADIFVRRDRQACRDAMDRSLLVQALLDGARRQAGIPIMDG